MGRIRKEGDKWVVDFRLPRHIAKKYGRARFRREYGRRALALKVHSQVQSAIALNDPDGIIGRLLHVVPQEYSVKTFYDRWISEYCKPRLEASTQKRYALSFKTFNDHCGAIPLLDFRRQHLHGYIQSRTGKVSASTINKDIIACKKMFSYAAEVGAIRNNPLVRFPSLKVQEKALRIPTAEEFRTLVESMADPAIGAMVAIMGETGIRRSEAINLEWKNVNLRTARITLERTKGKKVRQVPLSRYASNMLRKLTRFVHQPYVFCHQVKGARWVSPDKAFRTGRRKAKLEWITMHTLRHMRGTRWLQHGADIRVVQAALGHADVRTTQRYTHNVEGFIERALRDAQEVEEKLVKSDKRAGGKREA